MLSLLYGPALTSIHDYCLALTRETFVGKVRSLLFNILSRFVIVFLPRSKRLLISWLQSLSTVILKPKKMKSVTVSIFFLIYLLWSDGMDAMILDASYVILSYLLASSVTFVLTTSRFTSEFWALQSARLTNLIVHMTSPLEGLTDSSNVVYLNVVYLKLSFHSSFPSPKSCFSQGFPYLKKQLLNIL